MPRLAGPINVTAPRVSDKRIDDARELCRFRGSILTAQRQAEQRAFAERDLSARDYVYGWGDGVQFNVRLDEDSLCCLVIVGVRVAGTKETGDHHRWLSGVDRVVGRCDARPSRGGDVRPGARRW
jgi:hypothetical protein